MSMTRKRSLDDFVPVFKGKMAKYSKFIIKTLAINGKSTTWDIAKSYDKSATYHEVRSTCTMCHRLIEGRRRKDGSRSLGLQALGYVKRVGNTEKGGAVYSITRKGRLAALLILSKSDLPAFLSLVPYKEPGPRTFLSVLRIFYEKGVSLDFLQELVSAIQVSLRQQFKDLERDELLVELALEKAVHQKVNDLDKDGKFLYEIGYTYDLLNLMGMGGWNPPDSD